LVNRKFKKAKEQVFNALLELPTPCTLSELVRKTGLHRNTVRKHLDDLEEKKLLYQDGRKIFATNLIEHIDLNNFREYLECPEVVRAIWNYTLKKMEIDLDKNTTFKEKGTIEIPYPTEKGWKVIEEQKKKAEN